MMRMETMPCGRASTGSSKRWDQPLRTRVKNSRKVTAMQPSSSQNTPVLIKPSQAECAMMAAVMP